MKRAPKSIEGHSVVTVEGCCDKWHNKLHLSARFGKQEGHTDVFPLMATHIFIENRCWCRDGMICVVWMLIVNVHGSSRVSPALSVNIVLGRKALSVHCCRSCRQNSARPGQFSERRSSTVAHEEPAKHSSGQHALKLQFSACYSATSRELSFSSPVSAHSSLSLLQFPRTQRRLSAVQNGSASSWRECVVNSSPCAWPTVTCISASKRRCIRRPFLVRNSD